MFVYGLHDGNPEAVRYVGVTTRELEDRLRDHVKETRRAATYKRRWIRKAMAEGHKIGIVALDHAETEADLLWLEQFWIMALRALGSRLTNASAGGDGLRQPTPETLAKMSAAQSKRTWSDARRLKHSQLLKGRPRPLGVDKLQWVGKTAEERRARTEKAIAACRGRTVSDETRALIGEANTGKNPSAEARALMSQRQRDRWVEMSPEERRQWGLHVSGKTDADRKERSRKMLAARYADHVYRTPEERREQNRAANRARYARLTSAEKLAIRERYATGSHRAHTAAIRPVGHGVGASDANTVRLDASV